MELEKSRIMREPVDLIKIHLCHNAEKRGYFLSFLPYDDRDEPYILTCSLFNK